MMADVLKMMLAMVVFFGAMYLYAWLPDILSARREKKRQEKKDLEQKLKDETREKHKAELQKIRDDKSEIVTNRRAEIKDHLEWLEQINQQIKQRFNAEDSNMQQS